MKAPIFIAYAKNPAQITAILNKLPSTNHPDQTRPVRYLTCCCCGDGTRGRQWWNRDKGFGICQKCVAYVSKKESREEMRESYGIHGIHHSL